VRVSTAFNSILQIPGAWVDSVEFTDAGLVVGLRRRHRRHQCPGRAQGTCSVRTRPQRRQSTRAISASNHTMHVPMSRCRQRRRDRS
jgi:purine nucleoside permease